MVTPRNQTLRVLLEFVDDNCANLGWVLALLVGEAASDLERLSTSHDTLDRTHDKRVLPTAFVVLDDPGFGVVERLLRTSVITGWGRREESNDLDFEEGVGAPILVHSAFPLVN